MSSDSSDQQDSGNNVSAQASESDNLSSEPSGRPIHGRRNIDDRFFIKMFWLLAFLFICFVIGMSQLLTSVLAEKPKSSPNTLTNDELTQQQIQTIDNILSQARESDPTSESLLSDRALVGKILLEQTNKTGSSLQGFPQFQQIYYQKAYPGYLKLNQLPMCIVATGRNNVQGRMLRFLTSVAALNYANYRLVYVDDMSTDSTVSIMRNFIDSHPEKKLKDKWLIMEKNYRAYSLANKVKGIEQGCLVGDIIVDVDADDHFIGKQVLRIVNYHYSNPQIWLMYANYLTKKDERVVSGQNRALADKEWYMKSSSFYRTNTDKVWVTSHLKTYRQQLFMKLDRKSWVTKDGEFYHWASDRFIMYGLLELAGPTHTKYDQFYSYYYDQHISFEQKQNIVKPDKLKSQLETPYLPIQNLQRQQATKAHDFYPPILLIEYQRRAQLKYDSLQGSENM